MFEIGANVVAKVDGNKLMLEIDLDKEQGRSASGKSTIVATTRGGQSLPEHPNIKVNLNIYK